MGSDQKRYPIDSHKKMGDSKAPDESSPDLYSTYIIMRPYAKTSMLSNPQDPMEKTLSLQVICYTAIDNS